MFERNIDIINDQVCELQEVLNGHVKIEDLKEDHLDTIYRCALEIIEQADLLLRETGA